jgi:hypothetical protein
MLSPVGVYGSNALIEWRHNPPLLETNVKNVKGVLMRMKRRSGFIASDKQIEVGF